VAERVREPLTVDELRDSEPAVRTFRRPDVEDSHSPELNEAAHWLLELNGWWLDITVSVPPGGGL
jgi:hypothetical protein